MIYLDNAATTFPKPPCVAEAVGQYLTEVGASPGRSGHRLSAEAGRIVFNAREALTELIGAPDSSRIVFTSNATEALNMAILGMTGPGDHIVTTSVEHNSVVRPLAHLARIAGVRVDRVPCAPDGSVSAEAVLRAVKEETRLVVVTHASNVVGTILPVGEIGRRLDGAALLVDAAQTLGAVPLDVAAQEIDLLAFTGHKSLFGPPGIGGLYIREGIDVNPLKFGGTGSESEKEELPDFLPDRFESGTPNTAGLAGLAAGVRYVLDAGVERIRSHEVALTSRLIKGLRTIDRISIYGPGRPEETTAIVSVTIADILPSEVSFALDRGFDIMTRPGLHCAPSAHRTAGTFPTGTVRFSTSYLNSTGDVDAAVEAMREIAGAG